MAILTGCAATRGPAPPAWDSESPTPGISFKLTEISRGAAGGKTDVVYRLRAAGVPKGRIMRLWHRRRGATPVLVSGVYVDDSGRLLGRSGSEAELHVNGLAKGEPYELMLWSDAAKLTAYARRIPFPLAADGSGGCRVSMEIVSHQGDALLMNGSGFEPDSEINAVMRSGEEVHLEIFPASPRGEFSRMVFPAVYFKKPSGSGSYTATGKNRGVTLEHSWGAAALKPE